MNGLSLRLYVMVTSAISSSFASIKEDLKRESGQDLLEYALIGGFIAAALAAAFILIGPAVLSMAQQIVPCVDFKGSTACTISGP